jgi:hypothetical protein
MSFEEKYLKYKNKYLSLKNSSFVQTGGSFFKMPSVFSNQSPQSEINQNSVQNAIINYSNLTTRMKTINAEMKDQGLATKIQSLDDNWRKILDVLVNNIKSKEEAQKKYNGLSAELQKKQHILNEVKRSLDSFTPSIASAFNNAQAFILSTQTEVKNSEALLAQYALKRSQNKAQQQYNELVGERRRSMSEERGRSRSSSTSSLGSTPR